MHQFDYQLSYLPTITLYELRSKQYFTEILKGNYTRNNWYGIGSGKRLVTAGNGPESTIEVGGQSRTSLWTTTRHYRTGCTTTYVHYCRTYI